MLIIAGGLPRTGSTLQFNAIRLILSECLVGESHGYVDTEETLARILDDKQLESKEHILIKDHLLRQEYRELCDLGLATIFFTIRDLRDVAGSLIRQFQLSEDEALQQLKIIALQAQELSELKHTFFQKYEDIAENHELLVSGVSTRLHLPLTQEQRSRILDHLLENEGLQNKTSVWQQFGGHLQHSMRRLGISHMLNSIGIDKSARGKIRRFAFGTYDQKTLLHPGHVSAEGLRHGSYRARLSQRLINTIESEYGQWLNEFGYKATQI